MVGGGVPADDDGSGGAAEPERVGLLRLHELVPAAEELDLTDEVDRERQLGELGRTDWDEIVVDAPDHHSDGRVAGPDVGGGAGPGGDQDGEPLSEGQVRGMLEHRLGATPLEQVEPPDAPEGPDGPDGPGRPADPDRAPEEHD